MLETVIVVGIVGAALAFLVRHMARSLRGGAGCAGCACASQLCHIDGSAGRPPAANPADAPGAPGEAAVETLGQRAAAR
jgi:hypothetical protein